jgi:hypothetical protein
MATRKAAAGNIVRLRGLPAKSSKEDVLAFLDGCGLTSDRVHLRFKERRTAGEVSRFCKWLPAAVAVAAAARLTNACVHPASAGIRYIRQQRGGAASLRQGQGEGMT